MLTQVGDKILKTTLQTFRTFITVEIRFKDSSSSALSFFVAVLLMRANGF